jgi:hypothetical protein
MSEEWSPWVEHDGGSIIGRIPTPCRIDYISEMSGIYLSTDERGLPDDWPGFLWRWKQVRVGWFKTELKRVCDDPEYAAVIRYRIRKPRGLSILERVVANPAHIIKPDREPLAPGEQRIPTPVDLGRSFGSACFLPRTEGIKS